MLKRTRIFIELFCANVYDFGRNQRKPSTHVPYLYICMYYVCVKWYFVITGNLRNYSSVRRAVFFSNHRVYRAETVLSPISILQVNRVIIYYCRRYSTAPITIKIQTAVTPCTAKSFENENVSSSEKLFVSFLIYNYIIFSNSDESDCTS